jgi:hypothetical protein
MKNIKVKIRAASCKMASNPRFQCSSIRTEPQAADDVESNFPVWFNKNRATRGRVVVMHVSFSKSEYS